MIFIVGSESEPSIPAIEGFSREIVDVLSAQHGAGGMRIAILAAEPGLVQVDDGVNRDANTTVPKEHESRE